MGQAACKKCSGVGWGSVGPTGYVDDGVPCSTCQPDGVPKEPGSFAAKPERHTTLSWVDAQGRTNADTEPEQSFNSPGANAGGSQFPGREDG